MTEQELFEEEAEADQEEAGAWTNQGRGSRKKTPLNPEVVEEIGSIARFTDLQDPQKMAAAVERMGASRHHSFKILAISSKLSINMLAGVLFYVLLVDLFDVLSSKMSLYNQVTLVSVSVMQINFLTMEKVLWREQRLFKSGKTDAEFFRDGELSLSQQLDALEDSLDRISVFLVKVKLKVPYDNWYSKPIFYNKVGPNSQAVMLPAKEALSNLLSSGFGLLGKPESYFSRDRLELQVFFENCRKHLDKGISSFLEQMHNAHSTFSANRRSLLLTLLLVKVGLALTFIIGMTILYSKENRKKEQVISLYYGFHPADIKVLLMTNERLLTTLASKDYDESDAGLEFDKGAERGLEGSQGEKAINENTDEEHFEHLMRAKRKKAKGKLDKILDFNRFFIVFFALINTMYFCFLYVLNISNYMEYWGLARLARNNNHLSIDINSSYNKLATVLYNSRLAFDPETDSIEENLASYRGFREGAIQVAWTDAGAAGRQVLQLGNVRPALRSLLRRQLPAGRRGAERRTAAAVQLAARRRDLESGLPLTQGYLMLQTRFISEVQEYSAYLNYLKKSPQSATLSWLFGEDRRCVGRLQRSSEQYSAQELWDCFTLSGQFDETRQTFKVFLRQILARIIERVESFVAGKISDVKDFNLQFLLVVLLPVTLLLGVSWILIIIKDNRDVAEPHRSSSA